MNKETKRIFNSLLFLFIIYLALMPSYYSLLPTIPIYDNEEVKEVKKYINKRNKEDLDFFELTNESIVTGFKPYVKESEDELLKIIRMVIPEIFFFKIIINRPRPYQIDKDLNYIRTDTGLTPAMPAGHAYQAYYLSKKLSEKYPSKKDLFEKIAKKCDECRVYAGIHYPSDGEISKKLVNMFH